MIQLKFDDYYIFRYWYNYEQLYSGYTVWLYRNNIIPLTDPSKTWVEFKSEEDLLIFKLKYPITFVI